MQQQPTANSGVCCQLFAASTTDETLHADHRSSVYVLSRKSAFYFPTYERELVPQTSITLHDVMQEQYSLGTLTLGWRMALDTCPHAPMYHTITKTTAIHNHRCLSYCTIYLWCIVECPMIIAVVIVTIRSSCQGQDQDCMQLPSRYHEAVSKSSKLTSSNHLSSSSTPSSPRSCC